MRNTSVPNIHLRSGGAGHSAAVSRVGRATVQAAPCPCGGVVMLEDGKREFPRRILGRCNESPQEHVFSFDWVSLYERVATPRNYGIRYGSVELLCAPKNHPDFAAKVEVAAREFVERSKGIATQAMATTTPIFAKLQGAAIRTSEDAVGYAHRKSAEVAW